MKELDREIVSFILGLFVGLTLSVILIANISGPPHLALIPKDECGKNLPRSNICISTTGLDDAE